MPEIAGPTLDPVERSLAWVGRDAMRWGRQFFNILVDFGYLFGMRRPRLLRAFQGALRRRAPILPIPGVVLVTRADDVQAVLERDDDFLLGPVNERKFISGDFIISLDPGPQYREEQRLIHSAFPDDRVRLLRLIATEEAEMRLRDATGRHFDLVPYAEGVTVAIVRRFWGLRTDGARSRVVDATAGDDTMRLWLRKIAGLLGSRESASFGHKEVGAACAAEFMQFFKEACDARAAQLEGGVAAENNFLDRFLQLGRPTDVAYRSIAGMIITGTAVVTKAFAHAMEQLLRHEQALARARAAARANDQAAIEALLMEALRFNTVFPMIPRYSPRATTLAAGTARETEIPAGASVAAGTTGAMFDPEFVDRPETFSEQRGVNVKRDWDPGQIVQRAGIYLHFSAGTHWCPGDEMGLAVMGTMCGALLRRLNDPQLVAPMEWFRRPLRYDGPPVHSLVVRHG